MGLSRALWVSVAVVAALAVAGAGAQQLSPGYYNATCPNLASIVRRGMTRAVQTEPRMGASILRLFFHDCFVHGCDASVLLDDVPASNFTGEKNAAPNVNSLRGYEVIDAIKAQVEASCEATVSCADILALAARDAVNLLGGPTWPVPLGRLDALTANKTWAESNLPPPQAGLSTLLSSFSNKGLDARDLTALSGAHTVGRARCANFRAHIYGDANVNASYAAELKATVCPPAGNDSNLAPMEPQAPDAFDNGYFRDLLVRRVLLGADQALYDGSNGTTDALVRLYAANATAFRYDFAAAMVKLGNLAPPAGTSGEVRLNCRRVN